LCLGPVRTSAHAVAGTPAAFLERLPSPDEIAPLVLAFAGARVSARALDAESFAADPSAALAGDGRLALAEPAMPQEHAEAEPGPPPPGPARGPRVVYVARPTTPPAQCSRASRKRRCRAVCPATSRWS